MCVKERTGVGRYVETDVGKGTWRFRSGCVGTLFAQTGWLVDQFHFFYFSLHALHTHTHTHDTPPSHWSTHRKQKKNLKTIPDRVHCRIPRANHAQCGGTLHVLCPQQYTNIPQYLSPVAHHKIIFFSKKIIIFMLCLPFSPLPLSHFRSPLACVP